MKEIILISLIALSAQDPDRVSIQRLVEQYDQSWMAGDPEGVMNCFTSDAVLIPHHGAEPVQGAAAIREFWFPGGQMAGSVSQLESTVDEIQLHGLIAVVRGKFKLEFEWEGNVYRNEGNYLMYCMKDKEWKIRWRIWNDPVPETDP